MSALINSIVAMLAVAPPELDIVEIKVSAENGIQLFAEFCEGQYVDMQSRRGPLPTSMQIVGVLITWPRA